MPNLKKPILRIAGLVGLVACVYLRGPHSLASASPNGHDHSHGFRPYSNKALGVSLEVPSGWEHAEVPSGISFNPSAAELRRTRSTTTIAVGALGAKETESISHTLDSYLKAFLKSPRVRGFSVQSKERRVVHGFDSIFMSGLYRYRTKRGDVPYIDHVYVMKAKRRCFILVFTASDERFSDYQEDFDQALNSFRPY